MGMLLKLEPGKSPKETNKDQVRAVPEFYVLTDQQLTYVILYTDYHSPFRQQPDTVRKKLCAMQAGYKLEKDMERLDKNARAVITGKVDSVEKAIAKYKELQYDEDMDAILVIQTQIRNIKDLVLAGTKDVADMKKLNDLLNTIPDLRATQRKLQEESGIDFVAIDETTDNKKELSTIDKYNMEQMGGEI